MSGINEQYHGIHVSSSPLTNGAHIEKFDDINVPSFETYSSSYPLINDTNMGNFHNSIFNKSNFWIIAKLAVGGIAMSYLISLLKNKSHFMDKLFAKEFIDLLKHYRQILIALVVLLAIKLFNKLCSLIYNFNKTKYQGSICVKKCSIQSKKREIASDYALGNNKGISSITVDLFKRGQIINDIGITTDYSLKKALTLGAIALAAYGVIQSMRGVDSVLNIIPKEFRDIHNPRNLVVMILLIVALVGATVVWAINRKVDVHNAMIKTCGEKYQKHVGRYLTDAIFCCGKGNQYS